MRLTLRRVWLRRVWLAAALLIYLVLAGFQLGLPGLHYDEAKEAGLNAMQLLTGAPVTSFRDVAVTIGGIKLPLMVQDYIGALNVYLALPLLALTGIGAPNLRWLPVLLGLAALLLIERTVSEWWAFCRGMRSGGRRFEGTGDDVPPSFVPPPHVKTPITWAGLFTVTLLAVSPSYVFWARQGVFVTNLMLPCVFLCLWQGVRWLRAGEPGALVLSALGGGLALYAKLSAYWVVVPFALLAGGWWLYCRLRRPQMAQRLRWSTMALALLALLLPLLPLGWFNLQTGGTFASVMGNLGRSYYGVDNADVLANAAARWSQVVQILRGDQFWYLGAVHANGAAPWLALAAIAGGLWRRWQLLLAPLILATAVFAASLFTVSDLFVTHYVLLQPLLIAVAALGLGTCVDGRRFQQVAGATAALILAAWLVLDLTASIRYHASLATSGGLGDHSDASYHLAYHLQYNGMGAPVALDWGIDATVRYLSQGTVTPIEIFGYDSPLEPDDQFRSRLDPLLDNRDNRYILHAPGATVFGGRREAFLAAAQSRGLVAEVQQIFAQRDGTPIYEIWLVAAP